VREALKVVRFVGIENPRSAIDGFLACVSLPAPAPVDCVRPEPLEERRKRLARLLSRKTKAIRDGIQLSEAITGDGATIFRHACWMDLEGIVSKRVGSRYVSDRTPTWLKTKNPNFERR